MIRCLDRLGILPDRRLALRLLLQNISSAGDDDGT